MDDIDLDKLFGDDDSASSSSSTQPAQSQSGSGQALAGLVQAPSSVQSQQQTQNDQQQGMASSFPPVSKEKGAEDKTKKDEQNVAQAISMSPEGGAMVEQDAKDTFEKQFDELNEILDINLTDQIEQTTMTEATELPSVPEGSKVLKDKIEEETNAEKATQQPPGQMMPGQGQPYPVQGQVPSVSQPGIVQPQIPAGQQPGIPPQPQPNNQYTQQLGQYPTGQYQPQYNQQGQFQSSQPQSQGVFTGPPAPQWPGAMQMPHFAPPTMPYTPPIGTGYPASQQPQSTGQFPQQNQPAPSTK